MKKDWTSIALVFCLVCTTLAAATVGYQYLRASHQLKFLQNQAVLINQKQMIMQSLAVDLNEYARRNPSMDALLQKLNMRLVPGTNAPAPRQ